ncbi:Rieske 2Fe-2S domain-containing protein [Massilia sp. NEAU-DD11]|jgi:naphthalene 1,2-dioxygenase system ferredoxin subunit|uniref:Rieske 2Fe-2S domain-containing protein n=1 Tax=Massilia cellulosiltytica TaxID=2683234 RepID=A0A7X3K9E9_9BURK|nr:MULTISPECIES: non-heme iron oxygenase ferredoxin subunit [Telluria group]KQZ35005.1 naphthalene 1,2-dioxygenase [Massilia sp. Root1485]MVW62944.1 Rieske 2Fe-2S domain-containing protein [Telluria cellulosilytica]
MTKNWTEVLDSNFLPDDDVVGVDVEGRQLALYVVNGEVYATDNICTHGHARLCDGFLEDYEIECPLHQGRFDIRTGKAMCEPLTVDLKSYPVKIEDGRVFVDFG